MVRKYFIQQVGLLLMVAVIIMITNIIGYGMPLADTIKGVLVLCHYRNLCFLGNRSGRRAALYRRYLM